MEEGNVLFNDPLNTFGYMASAFLCGKQNPPVAHW